VAAYLARGLVERDLATRAPNAAVTHVDQMTERLAGADEPFAQPVYALGAGAAADLAEDARASRDDVGAVRAADLARGFAGRIAPWISRPTEPGSTATVDGPINPWLALAEAELVRASGRADPEAWRAAAAALADLPEVHLAAYANLRAAEADLRLRGVRAEVGETIRSVHETVLRLRAEPLRQDIESLARRARVALEPDRIAVGGRPRAPGPRADRIGPGPTLSAREIEVLRLVADGRTNGEIAERLFITRKTASVHVTHILDKLGVANRFEAAMAGSRLGLVGDAEDGPGGIARRDDPDGEARV
jgi:DNA-binding CsgD family transcriptional regulator